MHAARIPLRSTNKHSRQSLSLPYVSAASCGLLVNPPAHMPQEGKKGLPGRLGDSSIVVTIGWPFVGAPCSVARGHSHEGPLNYFAVLKIKCCFLLAV